MKVTFYMVKRVVKVNIYLQKEIYIKDNGKMMREMVWVI